MIYFNQAVAPLYRANIHGQYIRPKILGKDGSDHSHVGVGKTAPWFENFFGLTLVPNRR